MWVVQAVLPGAPAETGAGLWWSDAAPAAPGWVATGSDGALPDGGIAPGDPLAWLPGPPWGPAAPGAAGTALTVGATPAPAALAAGADHPASAPDLPGIALLLGGLLVLAGWRRARGRAR